MLKMLQFDVEIVAIDDLRPHPKNYRQHPDDQIEHIMAMIRDFDYYKNIVISRDNYILAGHGVVLAARRSGKTHVPVRRLDVLHDDPRAIKVLIADNEISHLAENDDRLLSELLKGIKEDEHEQLLGTGYDEMMLANLIYVTRPASEIKDFDEAAHWVGVPEYENAPKVFKLVISFDNEQVRSDLMKQLGIPKPLGKTGDTWSVWYPPRDREDAVNVRFED